MTNPTISEAKSLLADRTRLFIEKASELHGVDLTKTKIRFDLRGRAAGKARTQRTFGKAETTIYYNMGALNVEGGFDHLLNVTVPHETAHLVQYNAPAFPQSRQANTPHGIYWARVMNSFGIRNPQRCHNLPLGKPFGGAAVPAYTYKCACMTHQLTPIRIKRIEGGAVYRCGKCRGPLVKA